MAYDSLKALIRQYIKTNGEQEITGQILQNVLVEMVNQYPSTDGFATQSWVTSQGYATTSQLAGYLPLTGGTLTGALMTGGTTIGIQLRAYFDNDTIAIQRFENNDWVNVCSLSGPGYITGTTYHGNQYIVNNGTSSQFLKADGSLDSNTYITASALSGYATQSWVTTQLGSYLPLTGGTLTGALMTSGTTQGIQLRAYFDNDTIAIQKYENNDWVSVCSLSGPGYITGSTYHGNQYIVNNGTSSQFLKADGSVDSNTYITASALTGYATQSWVTTQLGSYLPLTGGTLTGALMTSGTTIGIQLRAYFDNDTIAIQKYENNDWVSVCSLSGTGYITGTTYHGNQYIVNNGTSSQFLKADGSLDSNTYITLASVKGNLSVWNNTAMTWGTLTAANGYTIGVHASSSDGGDWGMCYKSGQISMQLDGWYYQNEGRYRVVDTSDLASYNPTTNFKTINNQSIIGTGNINIEGGGTLYDAEVEYLESTGTQYINTGIKLFESSPTNLEISMKVFANTGQSDNSCILNAMKEVSPYPGLVIRTIKDKTYDKIQLATDAGDSFISSCGSVQDITITKNLSSVHDVPVTLFAGLNANNAPWRYCRMKLYSLSIKRNSVLVFDAIPVRVGNVGYLYDKVSGQLFGNSGTGDFVLGQDTGPGGGLPYLPLTGGTITGNLTVGKKEDGKSYYFNIYSTSYHYASIYADVDGLSIVCTHAEGDLLNVTASESYFTGDVYGRSFQQSSDLRKKTITGDVPINIYNVANAPLFKFTWNDEKKYSGQHIGSAAQYWQTVLPELVSIGRDADMTLAMQYDVIALASAITVAKTVVNHEERIILLERENEALRKEIADLKSA